MKDSPKYIDEQEVARITGRAVQTLRNDRHMCRGLPYRKLGRKVVYRLDEVIQAIEDRRIEPRPL